MWPNAWCAVRISDWIYELIQFSWKYDHRSKTSCYVYSEHFYCLSKQIISGKSCTPGYRRKHVTYYTYGSTQGKNICRVHNMSFVWKFKVRKVLKTILKLFFLSTLRNGVHSRAATGTTTARNYANSRATLHWSIQRVVNENFSISCGSFIPLFVKYKRRICGG